MKKWLYLRIGIIAFSFIAALLAPPAQPIANFSWSALAIITAATPFMLLFIIGIQSVNPRSATVWQRPSWKLNPFNFSEPLQFFELAAWVCLAQGIAALISFMLGSTPLGPEVFIGFAMAIGAGLGVRLCSVVFSSRITPNKSSQPTR